MEAMSQNKKEHYMPTLDGVRGLACLLVVALHMEDIYDLNMVRNALGSSGVLIFFALSGFLMGALYFEKACTFNNASEYFISRFSRITPAYYIAIAFATACYVILPDFIYQMTPVNVARAYAFMGSEVVFWSIPPEVQFYGFFFLIWLAWEKWKAGIKWPLMAIAVVSLALIASKEQWGGILLPSKLHIFLYGFLGAVILKFDVVKKFILNIYAQMVLGAAAIFYYHAFIVYENVYTDLLYPALIALAIVSFSKTTTVSSVLAFKPMRIVGHASFSIYLFHDLILRVIDHYFVTDKSNLILLISSLVAALGLPMAFHFLAEKPLNLWSKQKARDILATLRGKVSFLPKA